MRTSWSLRKQIMVLMTIIVAFQSMALVVGLISNEVFLNLDSEAFRLFDNAIYERSQWASNSITGLSNNIINEAESLSNGIIHLLDSYDADTKEAYRNKELYELTRDMALGSTLNLLTNNKITGAYIIFSDAYDNLDPAIHSSIYIRNSTPDIEIEDYSRLTLEIGPKNIVQSYGISLSENWKSLMNFTKEKSKMFYQMPSRTVQQYPGSELKRYGYWGEPTDILGDGTRVITYTLPLLDKRGECFGVIGIEISPAYFSKQYLLTRYIPYHTSFYTITNVANRSVDLEWNIPGGALAQYYLRNTDSLSLDRVGSSILWSTRLEGLGDMYGSVHRLNMYSEDSPFYKNRWSLIGFVSKESLRNTSKKVGSILMRNIVLTTTISIIAVFLLSYIATRKIEGLSDYVKEFNRYEKVSFKKTGLQEIDNLTYALQTLNENVINNAKITGKIMELTNMPMGCFEVIEDSQYVSVTSFIYDLLGLRQNSPISQKRWKEYYSILTAEPMKDFSNVYHYVNEKSGTSYWIRFSESKTQTGRVGTIEDVTEDVRINRHLRERLDYDGLTGLYNRMAFKGNVYDIIKKNPNLIGAMLFIDLDDLKEVNDTYGHNIGDKYLIQAAKLFNRFSQYGGIVSRIAGDEFAIYLHGYESRDYLDNLIKYELMSGEEEYLELPDGKNLKIRYSGGIAWYPEDSDNVTDLLKLSDYAMYEAKNNKKGSIFHYGYGV